MPLTVRELIQIPHLRTRMVAGSRGAERVVNWAHSVELDRPWEWLDAGDLLMTTGVGLPADASEQVRYVEGLSAAGVSAVAIGESDVMPQLSAGMLDAAERDGLPILQTASEVPFSEIGRAVAAACHGTEQQRLVKTTRVYDIARAAISCGSTPTELVRRLAEELGCDVWICATDSGTSLLPPYEAPPAPLSTALRDVARSRNGTIGGLVRLPWAGGEALAVPVAARRPAALIAVPTGAASPSFALLQHVATLAALELERLWVAYEETRLVGVEVFSGLVRGESSPFAARAHLRKAGLEDGPYLVTAVCDDGSWPAARWLHHSFAERAVPNLTLSRGGTLYGLLFAGAATRELLEEVFRGARGVGVSELFGEVEDVSTAAREARWALRAAERGDGPVLRFGESRSPFGPSSVAEARTAVDRVLRPLITYDQEHASELVKSLGTFLRCDRSWQRAAEDLFVHKQTLVYRMRRVEELTGRKLSTTSTVAEMWFALEALDLLDEW